MGRTSPGLLSFSLCPTRPRPLPVIAPGTVVTALTALAMWLLIARLHSIPITSQVTQVAGWPRRSPPISVQSEGGRVSALHLGRVGDSQVVQG